MKTMIVLLVFTCLGIPIAVGQSPNARIVDVRAYAIAGPSIVAPNNGYPVVIPTSTGMFTLTVALDEMIYSVEVRQSRHVKPSDFIVGDPVEVHLEGQKLIVIAPGGKQIKEKSDVLSGRVAFCLQKQFGQISAVRSFLWPP